MQHEILVQELLRLDAILYGPLPSEFVSQKPEPKHAVNSVSCVEGKEFPKWQPYPAVRTRERRQIHRAHWDRCSFVIVVCLLACQRRKLSARAPRRLIQTQAQAATRVVGFPPKTPPPGRPSQTIRTALPPTMPPPPSQPPPAKVAPSMRPPLTQPPPIPPWQAAVLLRKSRANGEHFATKLLPVADPKPLNP